MGSAVLDITRVVRSPVPPARLVALAAAKAAEKRAAAAYGAHDYETAIAHFHEARRLGLDTAQLHSGLGSSFMFTERNQEAIAEYRLALQRGSQDAKLMGNLIFLLDHQAETTLETALDARKGWWRTFGAPLRSTWRPHRNDRDPERPLRVGYVSGDFRRHSASQCFGPVIFQASEGYTPVCYHTNANTDEVTELFAAQVPEFHRVADLDDDALAARIRADRIDILVDLSGYSACNRLLAFCRRPAPVQVTGWGYALGTGLPVVDGFFADEITVPRGYAARGYLEPICYLPAIVPFTTMPYSDPVGPLPCLERGAFTFGSFNRWLKMSPTVLDTWAEILHRAPGSRLLLKGGAYDRADIRAQVLGRMAAREVAADRIEFRGWTTHVEHIRAYHDVDLALDPFPHSGGVTALEGLWHGVPPLTLLGERVPERLSASFCGALNLRFCVTSTRTQYIETAAALATEASFRPRLADIRSTLQHRIAQSPLCVGYTAAVEVHYRDLWRSWCRRQAA